MPVHSDRFQNASRCENYSLTRAIFEVNAAIRHWDEVRAVRASRGYFSGKLNCGDNFD
jgi:hypothetical protein